jgi:hypothetical protein
VLVGIVAVQCEGGESVSKVYPVGYSQYGAQKYIDELIEKDPKTLLIDTRLIPYSWRTEWRKEELTKKYRDRYRWEGETLGNLGKDSGYIRIANIDAGMNSIMGYFDKGHDLILLCQCTSYADCHVSSIVDRILQLLIVEVVRFGKSELTEEEEMERIIICQRSGQGKGCAMTWTVGDKVTCTIPWRGDIHGIVRSTKMEGLSQKV